jgi:hypothetical protein
VDSDRFAALEEEIRRERMLSAQVQKDNDILRRRCAENETLLEDKV